MEQMACAQFKVCHTIQISITLEWMLAIVAVLFLFSSLCCCVVGCAFDFWDQVDEHRISFEKFMLFSFFELYLAAMKVNEV